MSESSEYCILAIVCFDIFVVYFQTFSDTFLQAPAVAVTWAMGRLQWIRFSRGHAGWLQCSWLHLCLYCCIWMGGLCVGHRGCRPGMLRLLSMLQSQTWWAGCAAEASSGCRTTRMKLVRKSVVKITREWSASQCERSETCSQKQEFLQIPQWKQTSQSPSLSK